MFVFLPLLAFAFLTAGFRLKKADWCESLVFASVPWSLFLAFITEALTQFRILTRSGVAWSWFGFALLCFFWMWRNRRALRTVAQPSDDKTPLPAEDWIVLGALAAIAGLIALTALASAPNNWDAMEYHLPRVFEWMNNRGVQFYPTIDWAQLNQPPFAEYTMLHLDLLFGSDRLLGLVQWLAYLGSIVGATLLVRELGGGRRAQALAAVLAATIPSAILGASSTKNDGVAAYWIVIAAYLLLRWQRSQPWPLAIAIGAALGLAAFTKGTAYTFLPCIVLACVPIWNRVAQRRFLICLPAIAAMGVLVCAPLWVRNYQYTRSPLGWPYFYGEGDINARMYATTHVTPSLVMANGVRNLALHAGVPSDRINEASGWAFSRFIRAMGVDPNDRGQIMASQLGYTPRFAVRFNPLNEVIGEDPVQLLLFLMAVVLAIMYRRRVDPGVRRFGLGIVGAFFLYSALVRWSPWSARYQIPIFLLGAAFSAAVLARTLPRWAVGAIAGLVLLMALPVSLMNGSRPLITRHGLHGSILTAPHDETYFFDFHREMAGQFIAAAAAVRSSGCRSIGIDANRLHFEYPMMALMNNDGTRRQVRYVGVENSSTQYAQPSDQPICMVICLGCKNDAARLAKYSAELPKMQSFGTVAVFSKTAR